MAIKGLWTNLASPASRNPITAMQGMVSGWNAWFNNPTMTKVSPQPVEKDNMMSIAEAPMQQSSSNSFLLNNLKYKQQDIKAKNMELQSKIDWMKTQTPTVDFRAWAKAWLQAGAQTGAQIPAQAGAIQGQQDFQQPEQPTQQPQAPNTAINDLLATVKQYPDATVEEIKTNFPEFQWNEDTIPDLLATVKQYPDATMDEIMKAFPELAGEQQTQQWQEDPKEPKISKEWFNIWQIPYIPKISTEKEVAKFLDPLGTKWTWWADLWTAFKLVWKWVVNLWAGAVNMMTGLLNIWLNPKETAQWADFLVKWLLDNIAWDKSEEATAVAKMWGNFLEKVKDPQQIGQFITENPAEIISALSPQTALKVFEWWTKSISKTITPLVKKTQSLSKWGQKIVKESIKWLKTWELWWLKKALTPTKSVAKIEKWVKYKAKWQQELYKAQSPSLGKLTKRKDYRLSQEVAAEANELIVKEWYIPKDTQSRFDAHSATKQKAWAKVQKKLDDAWVDASVDMKKVANKVEEYIDRNPAFQDMKPAELKALKAKVKIWREKGNVSINYAENSKQMLNAIVDNYGDAKVSDILKNWYRQANKEIGLLLDESLSKIPWEFTQLKRNYWVLAETFEDVMKANLKNQRKKGMWLISTYSRLEGASDIIWSTVWLIWGKANVWQFAQWLWKIAIGKRMQKLVDPDFLVERWFKKLSKNMKNGLSPKIKDVPNTPNSSVPSIRSSNVPKVKGLVKALPSPDTVTKSNIGTAKNPIKWLAPNKANIIELPSKVKKAPLKVAITKPSATVKAPEASLVKEAKKYKTADEFVKSQKTPDKVSVWIKSKFSDKWAYKDIPVIRKVENKKLYQWWSDGKRQFWTENKEYAEKFGNVKEKVGTFYEVNNGNRVTKVYIDAEQQLTDIRNKANRSKWLSPKK